MNPFERKSIFIWNVPGIAGGDSAGIRDLLKQGGFEAVFIKAAQGGNIFHPASLPFPDWNKPNLNRDLVDVLHEAGIAVAGWGFCMGVDGDAEGRIAAQQVIDLGLDGWGFDIEGAFEAWGDDHDPTVGIRRAGKVIGSWKKNPLVAGIPTALISWARWRDPTPGVNRPWHNEPMAKFWMGDGFCDYGMPMCYEQKYGTDGPVPSDASSTQSLLSESLLQWREFTDKPIIPIGRAYIGNGGIPSAESVSGFDQLARQEALKGVSWWGLDWLKDLPPVWEAVASTAPFGTGLPAPTPLPEPLPPPTLEERIAALEADMSTVKKKLGL